MSHSVLATAFSNAEQKDISLLLKESSNIKKNIDTTNLAKSPSKYGNEGVIAYPLGTSPRKIASGIGELRIINPILDNSYLFRSHLSACR